MREWSYSSSHS